MFRDVRFKLVLNTTALWGAIPAGIVMAPLLILRAIGVFDDFVEQHIADRHPHMVAGLLVVLVGAAVFFVGAVMGFWVGLTREKVRIAINRQLVTD